MYHVTLNHKPEPLNPKLYNIVGPWRVLGVGVCAQLVAIQQDYDYSEMWSMVAGMANNSMKEEVFATMILPTKLLVTETCPTRPPSEQSQTITIPRCQVSSVPKWMIMSPSKTSKRGTNAYHVHTQIRLLQTRSTKPLQILAPKPWKTLWPAGLALRVAHDSSSEFSRKYIAREPVVHTF